MRKQTRDMDEAKAQWLIQSISLPRRSFDKASKSGKCPAMVPKMFGALWKLYLAPTPNIQAIQVPNPCPTVNLSLVNNFLLRNLPKPTLIPIQGAPQDPHFYEGTFPQRYAYHGPYHHTPYNEGCACVLCDPPFGRMWGFKTDQGVVRIPTEPVHGYIWLDGGGRHPSGEWVLAAMRP